MKDCFIEAGIIEESEAEHRLSFVIKAVAVAHFHLSLDRNETDIQNDQDYCVVDLGNISTGIAKVYTASTESLSTITAISDDIAHGLINLGIKFKARPLENMTDLNLNIPLIDRFVQPFFEKIKYAYRMVTGISQKDIDGNLIEFTYEDLNKIGLKPFVENIAKVVLNAYGTQDQCSMFISKNYGIKSHFIENLIARDKGKLKHYHSIVEDSLVMVSSGAVSSKISTYKSQTPFFLNEECRSLFSDKNRPFPEPVIEKATDNINENDAYDFIVGIDFGNSFSGCSYVQLRDKNGKPVDTKEIKTIKQDWYMKPESIKNTKNTKNTLIDNRRQEGNLNNFEKTPTLLMRNKMKSKYWGEEARLQVKHHKDLNLLKNFKLFLCPKSLENFNGYTGDLQELKKQGQFPNDENPKNEVDVVKIIADYLKLFKNHVIEYIVSKEMEENFGFFTRPKLLKKYKIRYVITVPAMWNASARDNMMQAAIEATIIKTNELDQLFMISELEAAALYCEKIVTESFNGLKGNTNDTNFIVCDAGGTTVDLFTFNLQVDEKKMSVVSQIGNGIGDTCGSNSLDLRFKGYLRDFYNSFGVNTGKSNILLDDIMQNFEYNIKPNFMPSLQDDSCYDINFLGKDPIDSTCNSDSMMANGNITLKMKNQDMKENIFDPIAERILALIDDQLNQAKKGNIRIDAILMVGGFSQSRYLQQRIKDQYKGVCYVSAPSDGAAAISLGAVSYALNPRVVTKKTAQSSLSLMVQAPLDKALTDSSEKMKGPNGDLNFKKDRLEYFVTKGQEFEHGRRTLYIKNIHAVYPNAAVIAIFACDSEEDANNRYLTKSHVNIMETKIIMPHMAGIDGRLIHFKVSLQIGLTVVRVTIECQDQLINSEVQKITRNQRSSLKIMLMCSLVTGT
ncbi:uncharacterized protein EV154DRAFT_68672 [Mucor mucedo]|uniref:uncharacterized protein n=1 Tax=Mucor mucedo TaxID=29922 RepID=UPI00221E7DDA|nr:uncharacterized protein EV154DRAFT_68672 [Mucor mucedo]KAI7894650.1 hypothetical protein EV154DRAFT_68672 [Mucor mucedo]